MAKSLELSFLTENGKLSKLSIDNPKEPINPAAVKQAMEQIISANIIQTVNGDLVASEGVRVIERNVTDYKLV
ncbi:DUF2922 domain-containing protein [Cytobacillus solani]|uniref:DUF2922 domain-containing protein n=1 Tax=Cytobacillus solani TaxID=1637975 RepID=UPI0006AB929D|nr:DUF2922 domain-containing protein [Cytobacillus solani]KOP82279.1 hypothetical protein AMS60_07125 [Bacillus sp. FJAT-21945]